MIAFDFEYYRPESIQETIEIFQKLDQKKKKVCFFSGGTEFITFARVHQVHADSVIDLKGIPECTALEGKENDLIFGASVHLNQLIEANLFPLLSQNLRNIADHTSRNKITLGGNLNSRLMYREGMLPLLVADAKVTMYGIEGHETHPITQVFGKQSSLKHGQFLTQISIDGSFAKMPYLAIKRTRISKIGYPIVSIAALVKDEKLRIAFSGICEYPFRSRKIEDILNDKGLPVHERIDKAVSCIPGPMIDDRHASGQYRKFVLQNVLEEAMEFLEG